jgi:hypothetical protein
MVVSAPTAAILWTCFSQRRGNQATLLLAVPPRIPSSQLNLKSFSNTLKST